MAQAQTVKTPTVSTIVVTSGPGADNSYATGDKIEARVTFNETVTSQRRTGPRAWPSTSADSPATFSTTAPARPPGSLIFGYTVFAGDMDADGIPAEADGLALNGGTIRSTDNYPVIRHSSHFVELR